MPSAAVAAFFDGAGCVAGAPEAGSGLHYDRRGGGVGRRLRGGREGWLARLPAAGLAEPLLEVSAVGGCGVGVGGLGGLAAHGVAEAEEAGADQREREEDAEDGRSAERYLAVGADRPGSERPGSRE